MRATPATRRWPRRTRRTQGRTAVRVRDLLEACSCCGLFGVAQNGPVNVRAKVLASNESSGGPLDCRAAFGWRLPYFVGPLAQKHGRYPAEPFRQFCGRTVLV